MSTDIKRNDTGIFTVEGNLAGSRAARMAGLREKQKADFELRRKQIQEENERASLHDIDSKFVAQTTTYEDQFKQRTVGLVSIDAFKSAKAAAEVAERKEVEAKRVHDLKRKREKIKKKAAAVLSFDMDGEEPAAAAEEAPIVPRKKRVTKDPTVDTHFLPDKHRDEERAREKERLAREWLQEQERVKEEPLEVTFSYWDGSGHRRSIAIRKGFTVGKFLEAVRQDLMKEFPELRGVSAENLLYVKEDLIIPHHHTFYELIVTKARGKSGPLFHFDVHDDVRMMNDARVEKDESHPGKIVERRWFERNKHIFPASRWEVFDPTVKRDKYTIHGDEVRGPRT